MKEHTEHSPQLRHNGGGAWSARSGRGRASVEHGRFEVRDRGCHQVCVVPWRRAQPRWIFRGLYSGCFEKRKWASSGPSHRLCQRGVAASWKPWRGGCHLWTFEGGHYPRGHHGRFTAGSHWCGSPCVASRLQGRGDTFYEESRDWRGLRDPLFSRRPRIVSQARRCGFSCSGLASRSCRIPHGEQIPVHTRGDRGQWRRDANRIKATTETKVSPARSSARSAYRFRKAKAKAKEAHNRFIGDDPGVYVRGSTEHPATTGRAGEEDERESGDLCNAAAFGSTASVPGSRDFNFGQVNATTSQNCSGKVLFLGQYLFGPQESAGVGEGQATAGGPSEFSSGAECAVGSTHNIGGTSSSSRARCNVGSYERHCNSRFQGSGRPSKVASRPGITTRSLLRLSDEIYEQEDVTYDPKHYDLPADDGCRHMRHEVLGEVRRLRQESGFGSHPVSGHEGDGFPPDGELGGHQRHNSPVGGHAGAGSFRRRTIGFGPDPDAVRRPPICHILGQTDPTDIPSPGLCTISRSKMDHHQPGLHKGVGHYLSEEARTDFFFPKFHNWRRSRISHRQRKRRCKGEGQGQEEAAAESRGGDVEEDLRSLLEGDVPFLSWAMALPRCLLSSRTSFSWFLRRTFSAKWQGQPLHTVVFPLPIPFPSAFESSGPGLSKKQIQRVAAMRLTHVVCMALNYLHHGGVPSLGEVRRPPGARQVSCIRRLYNYVATCGSRQERFPCAPGRSGPELIASLVRLEAFVSLRPEFGNNYANGDVKGKASELPVEVVNQFPELKPYRPLDASRLKLKGTGRWPIEDYISGPLWLPYVEPAFLLHHQSTAGLPIPSFEAESREEYLKLARRWEELGLLRLVESPPFEGAYVRVFNAYKDSQNDRQIGDRRIINHAERHTAGPSSRLPQGQMLTALRIDRNECLRGSITDRRDFYHQCAISSERAFTNLVPFSFPASTFKGSEAFEEFERRRYEEVVGGRDVVGDRLGLPKKTPRSEPSRLFPSFGALYQGDHLGVEYALAGHEGLLVQEGLLGEENRLIGGRRTPQSDTWEALIIDDYFVISAEPRSCAPQESRAFHKLHQARAAYAKHNLEGSPEKDVVAADIFKAAGAEVDSRGEATSRGLALIGSPLGKRIGLASVSLRIARLGCITPTLAARITGGWISSLLYRRCIASGLNVLFSYGLQVDSGEAHNVLKLSEEARVELMLMASLAPMMASNAMVNYSRHLFATDSSMSKGAIVVTNVEKETAELLWKGGERKGFYTRLENPFRQLLDHIGEEPDEEEVFESAGVENPRGEIPFFFDFVEICGGVGAVSSAATLLGLVVAPVLDLSNSRQYNIKSVRMLEWIFFMLDERRFASFLLAPPCTTFSPAAHPAVRSYQQPKGFCRTLPKVSHGNGLAFKSILILRHGRRRRRPGLLEQPRLSKMAWLSAWAWLRSLGCEEAVVAACQFGSIHRKEFRLLCTGLDVQMLEKRCGGGHTHIPIQGKYTKGSAVYPEEMAMHIAKAFKVAIGRALRKEEDERPVHGFESLVINDLMLVNTWGLERSWFWKSRAHINVYEAATVSSLLKQLVWEQPSTRHNIVVDSRVALGALSKGRSSARALQPVLRRSAAYQIAGDLYPAISFGPTRIIPADAPSRDRPFEPPVEHSLISFLDESVLPPLHDARLTRPYSNWVRLSLLIIFLSIKPVQAASLSHGLSQLPVLLGIIFWCGAAWLARSLVRSRVVLILVGILLVMPSHVAAPIGPTSTAEEARAMSRAGLTLASDRLVRQQTRENRHQLLSAFKLWLSEEQGLAWDVLTSAVPIDLELLNRLLVAYGRQMHAAGKSYGKFAETVNAVAMAKPLVKRHLTMAWDLCFAWLQDEPAEHHPAMPVSVLLASMSVALLWGWPAVAAILGLAWSGLLRIGEVLAARRCDLVLPFESAPGTTHILLKIRDPKTRGRVARHQAARIDPADLVSLIQAVFGRYAQDQPLWEFSGSTLRKRFTAIMSFLELPTAKTSAGRPYDLASLRPGGATYILGITEDSELVRRRGRWISSKVLEVYLQEIAVATAVARLPEDVRLKVGKFASAFDQVLPQALKYLSARVPVQTWHLLFRQHHQRQGSHGR